MKRFYLVAALTVFLLGAGAGRLSAQDRFAVKTNLLYGGLARTPNLGVEVGIAPRWTLELSGGYNPFNLKGSEEDNRKLVHWIAMPEFRYWTCQRFNGHFLGVHALYSNYNISNYNLPLLFGKGSKEYRFEGWAAGGGVSYGYSVILGKRWNLEFTVGVGVMYLKYDRYECLRCGKIEQRDGSRLYFGPTKAGVTLSFLLW